MSDKRTVGKPAVSRQYIALESGYVRYTAHAHGPLPSCRWPTSSRSSGRACAHCAPARGWTIRELAERSGVSVRFLVQLEAGRGNISVSALPTLAQALGLPRRRPAVERRGADAPRLVALLGLRGAGKTTLARQLARRLRIPFRRARSARSNRPPTCRSAISSRSTARTTTVASSARRSPTSLGGTRPTVLATGGGIVTSPDTYALLKQRRDHGLAARLAGGSLEPRRRPGRPPADGGSPAGHGRPARAARVRGSRSTRRPRLHRGDQRPRRRHRRG